MMYAHKGDRVGNSSESTESLEKEEDDHMQNRHETVRQGRDADKDDRDEANDEEARRG
jgi:hypothetical protein